MAFPFVARVDPAELKLPTSRLNGADPIKLSRQLSRFDLSIVGMPRPLAVVDPDGMLQLIDGVTRATRVAKLLPGTIIEVEVIAAVGKSISQLPSVGDRLP
jgi:hypothetical protein